MEMQAKSTPQGISPALRIAGMGLVLAAITLTSLVSYLFFHAVAEVTFVVVGFGALIMAITLREFLDDDFAVFVGVGLGAAALLHLVHMVDFPGMDIIGESADPPTQLWLAARMLLAVTFVAAPFVLGRHVWLRIVVPVYGILASLVVASIYWWDVFPSAYSIEDGLTPFKVITEYVISALFALAIVLLWRRRALLPATAFPLLVAALVASIIAELWFTLYTGPHTWPNMAGHIFLALSAMLMYLGVIEDSLARPHAFAVANLQEAQRLHGRLERSLLPSLPVRHSAVDVLTHYRPGEHRLELGGDFIDVVEDRDDVLAVICGDVSGHGPDAAALGAVLRVGWKALVLSHTPPQRIVESLRQVLVRERQDEETFATACLAWIDLRRGEVRLINIGHPPPLMLGERAEALTAPALPPLGTLDLPVREPTRIVLPELWSLVFYTDGLIEGRAAPGDGERFGEERLLETLERLSCGTLDAACLDDVMEEVESAGGEPFVDDVTVVVVSSRDRSSLARPADDGIDAGAGMRSAAEAAAAVVTAKEAAGDVGEG
jgi:hypothetical protein